LLIAGKAPSPVCDRYRCSTMPGSWTLPTVGDWIPMTTQTATQPGWKGRVFLQLDRPVKTRSCIANVASGHRFLGRGGLGAVMGSKNLKGIVARGKTYQIVPTESKTVQPN
jgi:aldehyde:ferredoxin oxidoreductase